MIWRVRYSKRGGHVHCRLFVARETNRTFAKCGDFVVGESEFESLCTCCAGVHFLADEEAPARFDRSGDGHEDDDT